MCLTWLIAVVVLASAVSGKQAKYLLPVLPAMALLVTHAVTHVQRTVVTQRPWLLAVFVLLAGAVLALLPGRLGTAPWVAEIHPAWGLLLAVLAMALLMLRDMPVPDYIRRLVLLSVVAVGVVRSGAVCAGSWPGA